MFLTALWMLSFGFEVDCPSHGSSEFPTRQLVDQSSLHPGKFLCFGHKAAPNALEKYAQGQPHILIQPFVSTVVACFD